MRSLFSSSTRILAFLALALGAASPAYAKKPAPSCAQQVIVPGGRSILPACSDDPCW